MSETRTWIIYAVLGAFFAAVTNVLSKPALAEMHVSVANAIRAVTMVVVLVAFTTLAGHWGTLSATPRKSVVLVILAGVAASASWLCGYQALKMTTVANSYPIDKLSVVFAVLLATIFLGERPTPTNWLGIAIILLGGYLVTRPG